MQYREITIKDYGLLIEFWNTVPGIELYDCDSLESMEAFLSRNAGLSFICEDGGRVTGTVLCGHDGRRGYIYHLAVSKDFRKQGIGKNLLERALEGLRETGIKKCHLFVFGHNLEAKKFYEAAGWLNRNDINVFSKNT